MRDRDPGGGISEGRRRDDSGKDAGGGSVRVMIVSSLTSSDVFDNFFMVGGCVFLFSFCLQATPGSSRKEHWIASERALQTKQRDPQSALL